MSTVDVVVRRAWHETPDVKAFELVAAGGGELPAFSPGAHVDVHIADGLTRQYSICNGPGEHGFYLIGVKRELESRGGSAAMHDAVGERSTLRLGGPRNNFPLVEEAAHSLLVAGGIGVTPLVSMARDLAVRSRSFALHHFVRHPRQTAFRELLAHEGLAARATYHYGLVPPGLEATLEDVLAAPPPGANLYLCGPKPFMDLVQAVARRLGWADGAIHLEYFAADTLYRTGESFEVVCARSRRSVTVPEDKTIIEVLRANGVEIETSCEQGVCGTCLTKLLEGEPDHRDLFLQPDEQESGTVIMPCVSRARSPRLVLDL
jgi:vanillate O-demethylase ferredoxin subunit